MSNMKHIEAKEFFVEDVKLNDFFKNMRNSYSFAESRKLKSEIEKFLTSRLGYRYLANKGSKLIDRSGKEATIQGILNRIEEVLQINDDFNIELALCRTLSDYIDLEKTSINIEVPIDINSEEQEFMKKIGNCPKIIKIGYGIEDTPQNSKEWLNDIDISYVINREGEEIDFSIEEILEKYKIFKEYADENQEYAISYNYFINQELDVHDVELFKEIEKIETWKEERGINKERVKLRLNTNKDNVKDIVNSYIHLHDRNNKYYAEMDMRELTWPKYLENENTFRIIDAKRMEKIHQLEKTGLNMRASCNDPIAISVDTIAEVDESIFEKYNISNVIIGRKENSHENVLTISQYRKLREKLEEVVRGIDINESEENRTKEVYTRLANMLTYDYEAAEDDTEYAIANEESSRNLINGLLSGKCLCAGYSEILKQALSLVGIESHYITSKENAEKNTHAYNIIKINGNWYNADLTWDSDDIRNNVRPKYFLKNDKDFRKIAKEKQNLHIQDEEIYECTSKSLNLYTEYKKSNPISEFVKEAKDAFTEFGPKQAMINLFTNVGKIVKDKINPKKKLLPASTDKIKVKTKEEGTFKKQLLEGVPTLEEQSIYNEYLTRNVIVNEKNDEEIEEIEN